MAKSALSRSAVVLGSLFLCGFIASAINGCSGIDEPDLFTGDPGDTTTHPDGGKSDAGKDSGKVDTGAPSGGGSVQCASGPCPINSDQVCCYSVDSMTGTCDLSPNCSGDNQFTIPCDSTQDCTDLGQPDTLCCAQADQTGNVTNIQCRSSSNCRSDQGQTNLCDPAVADPCPNGGTCQPSTVSLPGYYLCVVQ